jgi:hypothetical protein
VPLDEDSFAYAFRSSGELTERLENNCENTNTHSHDNVLLVVLAHLRRQWSLSAFVKVKCLFSTTPEAENFSKSSWIETKVNGGH